MAWSRKVPIKTPGTFGVIMKVPGVRKCLFEKVGGICP
jgi:hypothetical protein